MICIYVYDDCMFYTSDRTFLKLMMRVNQAKRLSYVHFYNFDRPEDRKNEPPLT